MFIANDVALDRSSGGAKCNRLEQRTKAKWNCSHFTFRYYGAAVLIDTPFYKHYVPPGLGARREGAHEKKI